MRSTTSATGLSAFSALEAILISSSLTLTTKRSPGRKVVVHTPTKEVEAIPIA